MKNISFVSFYTENSVSPVHQKISNLKKHFSRRGSLYLCLGIPPSWVREKEVIEFGPGSGHNSIFTASLKPKKYTLIEGNSTGFKETKEVLEKTRQKNLNVVKRLFLKYKAKKLYDLVLAEGCIPHQKNPTQILKHISKFTKIGGIFVCTAANGISCLSEMPRRLIYNFVINDELYPLNKKINLLLPILIPHLVNCKGMSRSFEDWIIDNIIQPLSDRKLLSIPDVINTLKNHFQNLSTSPKIFSDDRWYKNIKFEFNKNLLKEYYKTNLTLIDYRLSKTYHCAVFGQELENITKLAWSTMCKTQKNFSLANLNNFISILKEIKKIIKKEAPKTSLAIGEAIEFLREGAPRKFKCRHFTNWWGRGQQYVSFYRTK